LAGFGDLDVLELLSGCFDYLLEGRLFELDYLEIFDYVADPAPHTPQNRLLLTLLLNHLRIHQLLLTLRRHILLQLCQLFRQLPRILARFLQILHIRAHLIILPHFTDFHKIREQVLSSFQFGLAIFHSSDQSLLVFTLCVKFCIEQLAFAQRARQNIRFFAVFDSLI